MWWSLFVGKTVKQYYSEFSAKPISYAGEDCILGQSRDITERKRAEEALRESEVRYRGLVENAVLGVYQVTKEGQFLMSNQRMAKIFGYDSQQEFSADVDNINELYANPEERPRILEVINKAGHVNGIKINFKRKDGNPVFCNVYVRSIQSEEGEFIYEGLLQDITDVKKMEAQLQQAQKMEAIGTLAGGIAHDFNNLLMAIQGRASIMLMSKDFSHPDIEHLKGIEDNIESAADLTRQLLGFARGGKYEVRPTDLNELLKKQNRMFGRTKKEITIQGKYEENLWSVEVDRGQIEQVLLNRA